MEWPVVDAVLRRRYTRQVVQHLPGDREVGLGAGRRGSDRHGRCQGILGKRKTRQHGGADLLSQRLAGHVGELEVDTPVDTAAPGLVLGLAEIGETAGDPRQSNTGGGETGVFAESSGQHRDSRSAERGVARNIVGVRRVDEQRGPVAIGHRGSIAIRIGVLDRGHGPPVAVGVLGVPAGDGGVGQRDIELCEQARIGRQAVALGGGHLRRNLVPVTRRREASFAVGPELRLLGLVRGAGRPGGHAELFDFVDCVRIGGGVESRWWTRTEFTRRGQRKRRHILPLGFFGNVEHGPGGTPLAQGLVTGVQNECVGTVALTGGPDSICHAQTQCNAGVLGRAIREGPQVADECGVEDVFLGRIGEAENPVCRHRRCHLRVDRAGHAELDQIGRAAFDGGQRVILRQAEHRQRAGSHFRIGRVALDSAQGDVVPDQHRVGLRLRHTGQRAREGLRVAGRIGGGQRDQVVAQRQFDVGQYKETPGAGNGADALAGQCDGGAFLGLPIDLRARRCRLRAGGVAGIGIRECK